MMPLNPLGWTSIVFSEDVLSETPERNFPESRHRSRRVHKKLCRRYGGEFRSVPTMFVRGATIYAHPSLRSLIEQATTDGLPPR